MFKSARFFLCFLFLVFSFRFLAFPVFAQPTLQNSNTNLNLNINPDVPQSLHTTVQTVTLEVVSSLTCQLVGLDPVNPHQKCLGVDKKTGKIGFVENGGGAVGVMTSLIAVLYTPPLNTRDYVQYVAGNFGIAKKAYAQGTGFNGLRPLLRLWTAFRNVAYFLFVILFVIVGLAIMLRIKIDQKVVMSIENQIPKVIVGLVLTTFSFAIAGLMIDLMWVIIYLFVNVLASTSPNFPIKEVTSNLHEAPIGFFNEVFKSPSTFYDPFGGEHIVATDFLGGVISVARDAAGSLQNVFASMFAPRALDEIFKWPKQVGCSGFHPACWAGNFIGGTIGTILSQIFGWVISWVVGILAFFVIIIAILWSLFRLWFQLLEAYIYLILDVIFAPFWIIIGILPGGPLGFAAWIRELMANLLSFPVAIVIFMIGRVIMDSFKLKTAPTTAFTGNFFVPPLIGNPSAFDVLSSLIGLGIILIAPTTLTMMRDYLKAPQFKYTAAIGQAIGQGTGVPGRLMGTLAEVGYGPKVDPGTGIFKYQAGAFARGLRLMGFKV